MRIQYLAFIRLPTEKAHGLQIMKTCEALSDAGAEVELVVPGRKTHITEDPFSYYGVRKNFTITRLGTPDLVGAGPIGFLFSLLCFSEAAVWRKEFWDADIVFSRDAAVLLQYFLLGRKLVYEAHQKPTGVSRFISRLAFRTVVITESLKRAFVGVGVRPERIIVAHDAADAETAERRPRAVLGLPEGTIIAYAGALTPEKGLDTLIEAAALLPKYSFVLAGDTAGKKFPNAGKNVIFLGHKPPAEARAILAASDAVLVPNSGRTEWPSVYTSPLKLFEALESGVPAVVSDVPAMREIADETCVFFFTPDNAESLAASAQEAIENPDEAARRIRGARGKVKNYTWEARAQAILSELRK